MTTTEFIEKNREAWNELEALLNRPRNANAAQLNRLGYLYRRVTSDLAVARRDFPQDRCVPYLNELASRAHATVYQTSPFKRGTFRQFFHFRFPTIFRENLGFIGAAFLMFAIAFAASYWIGLTNAELAEKLIPERVVSHIKKLEDGAWNDTSAEMRNLFASFVMTNNIRVAFLAFAWGIMFMVGTAYILVFKRYPHRCGCRVVPCQRRFIGTLVVCIATRLHRTDNDLYRRWCRTEVRIRTHRAVTLYP